MMYMSHPDEVNSRNREILSTMQKGFLLVLFWMLVSLSGHAPAENNAYTEEWHYTLRPGDSLHSISSNLLNHQYSLSDIVKHNNIETNAIVAPGSIIKIPMHWLKHQPQPAKIQSLTGTVQIKRASSSRLEILKTNMQVRVGDEVITRNGSAVIELADGSIIRLDEQSSLFFNRLSHFGKTGMVDTQLRLNKGSLSTDIPPLVKGSRYEIKTPSAVAAVRGTEFRLKSDEQGSQIEVLEGVVEFGSEHGQILVNAGQGASVSKQSPRIDVITLPNKPQTQLAQDTINQLPARIEWEKDRSAQSYEIRLTEKDKHGMLLKKSQQQENAFELDRIKNGEYALSISSVNGNGFRGPDATSRLKVDIKGISANLLAPLNHSSLTDINPLFTWEYGSEISPDQANDLLSKLEVALDPDFAAVITDYPFTRTNKQKLEDPLIPGRYYWRVSSMTNESEVSHSDVQSFYLKGKLALINISSVNYMDKQVGLFWSHVPNAEGYILQLSETADFSRILKEEKLSKPRAHLLLNEGTKYFARVKGIASELYISNFGPVEEIFIKPK